MSRLISDILSAKEPEFSHNLHSWERLAHKPAVDIVLTTDIRNSIKRTTKDLTLDVEDTTPRELYYGLRKQAINDSYILEKKLGITPSDSSKEVTKKILAYAQTVLDKYSVWNMKTSVAKRLIKAAPPKKLMKALGYRSIDSVLKRESPNLLIVLSSIIDPDYGTKLAPHYKKLKVSDFDTKKISLEVIPDDVLAKLQKQDYLDSRYVLCAYQTGAIIVVPPSKRFEGDALLLLVSIVEAAKGVAMYSSYFKTLSVEKKFGDDVAKLLQEGLAANSRSRMGTGWSSLHALANKDITKLPEELGPHIQDEDLKTPSLSDIKELEFWHGKLYVVQVHPEGVISCNILDVLINLANNVPHEKSVRLYGQSYLWDELIARYLLHEPIRKIVINLR